MRKFWIGYAVVCASTVTFLHPPSGLSAEISFTILEPAGYGDAIVEMNTSHAPGKLGVSGEIRNFFPPMNVSFYNVMGMEIGMTSEDATGWFANHPETWVHVGADIPFPLDSEESTIMNNTHLDPVAMETPRTIAEVFGGGILPLDGTMTWPVPAVWWVKGDAKHNPLPWSDQHFSVTTDGTVTITKYGVSLSRTKDDVRVPDVPQPQ